MRSDEMRIIDWGSDVCSSDLYHGLVEAEAVILASLDKTVIAQGPGPIAELLDVVDDQRADRGDVERRGERVADADRPLEAAVVIFGDIEPRGGVELDRAVVEDRRGGEPAMLDHLRIEMRFQRRARLPPRVGAIDMRRGRFKRSEERTSELQS